MKICGIRKQGVILSAMIISLFLLFSGMTVQAAEYVSIKKDGVNIRSGPSTKNPVLWEVFKGFPLKVLARKNDWVQVVDFEGDKGWIYASLLTNRKTVIVKVDTANMRSGPGTNFEIIATAKKQVVFAPVSQKGAWIKVNYKDEITGWMHNSLVWPANP